RPSCSTLRRFSSIRMMPFRSRTFSSACVRFSHGSSPGSARSIGGAGRPPTSLAARAASSARSSTSPPAARQPGTDITHTPTLPYSHTSTQPPRVALLPRGDRRIEVAGDHDPQLLGIDMAAQCLLELGRRYRLHLVLQVGLVAEC